MFHKEPLTSEEPFFHRCFFVAKEGSSDSEKVRKRWFFKESLTNLRRRCEEPFEAHLFFKSVRTKKLTHDATKNRYF